MDLKEMKQQLILEKLNIIIDSLFIITDKFGARKMGIEAVFKNSEIFFSTSQRIQNWKERLNHANNPQLITKITDLMNLLPPFNGFDGFDDFDDFEETLQFDQILELTENKSQVIKNYLKLEIINKHEWCLKFRTNAIF